MSCNHSHSSWVGIVTNDPRAAGSGAHMSFSCCGRTSCIDRCIQKVEKFTGESAELHTYASLRAIDAANGDPR